MCIHILLRSVEEKGTTDMNPVRKIEIHCSDINKVRHDTNDKILNALGYLSTWGMNSVSPYADVSISINASDYEVGASYRNSDGKQTYFIAGIWHGDDERYSFHS